jgi:hypothetical protein
MACVDASTARQGWHEIRRPFRRRAKAIPNTPQISKRGYDLQIESFMTRS